MTAQVSHPRGGRRLVFRELDNCAQVSLRHVDQQALEFSWPMRRPCGLPHLQAKGWLATFNDRWTLCPITNDGIGE